MILSAYMHSREWMGYLTKLGNELVLIMDQVHTLGVTSLWVLLILCSSIVTTINTQYNSALQPAYKTSDFVRVVLNKMFNPHINELYDINLANISSYDELYILSVDKSSSMRDDEACFVAKEFKMQPNIKLILETILANEEAPQDQDNVTKFFATKPEFGTDNCATRHMCNDKTLFYWRNKSINQYWYKRNWWNRNSHRRRLYQVLT